MLTGVKWFWLGKSACLALKGQTSLNKEVLASLFPLTVLILQMKTDYFNPIYTLQSGVYVCVRAGHGPQHSSLGRMKDLLLWLF